jgi:hypothetical protein
MVSSVFSQSSVKVGTFERRRRRIVLLIEIFLFLIIFEGVIRKWITPDLSSIFLFIRDPICLYIYVLGLLGYRSRGRSWLFIYLCFCIVFVLLAILQNFELSGNVIIIVVAFRYYLFFVPMAFLMYENLLESDIYRISRKLICISPPLAVLVIVQFYSPVSSIVNKGIQIDDFIFQVVEGVVRPYGTFTFAAGQVYFAVLCLASAIVCFHAPPSQRPNSYWLVAGTAGAVTMGALSGSRSYFLSALTVFIGYMAVGFVTGRLRSAFRALLIGAGLLGVFGIAFVVVFPQALVTMSERQENAVGEEGSTQDRLLYIFTEFADELSSTPAFGRGVGLGTNAGTFVGTGERGFALAEYEWTRLVQELGPFVGILIIFTRILLFCYLGMIALRASKLLCNNSPGAIFGFVGPLVLIGQVTTQNTILGLTWFAMGYLLAMARPSS